MSTDSVCMLMILPHWALWASVAEKHPFVSSLVFGFGSQKPAGAQRDLRHLVYLLVPDASSPATFNPTGGLSDISCSFFVDTSTASLTEGLAVYASVQMFVINIHKAA